MSKTYEEKKQVILYILADICPDQTEIEIDPDLPFKDQLDMDSMDFLELITELRKLGVNVPAEDYPKLKTLNSAIEYLGDKL